MVIMILVGAESKSHIETIWAQLKLLIKKLYITLKPDNIIYFIRELEFRYNIRNKHFDVKLKELQEIL